MPLAYLAKSKLSNGKLAKLKPSHLHQPPKQPKLKCPECSSERLYKDGLRYPPVLEPIQRWLCRDCGYRFSEKPLQESHKWSINNSSKLPYTRQICALEAKNLGPTSEIKTVAGMEKTTEADIKGKLLQFALYCKKEGLEEITVRTFNTAIRSISSTRKQSRPRKRKRSPCKDD